ncbi:hypothetical protein P692DRAFT_20210813 [Suillus brevipes Sb2]|nr:hypothetical protein P692DRAFT_20210813 [Suillus brevipes Sb2]
MAPKLLFPAVSIFLIACLSLFAHASPVPAPENENLILLREFLETCSASQRGSLAEAPISKSIASDHLRLLVSVFKCCIFLVLQCLGTLSSAC